MLNKYESIEFDTHDELIKYLNDNHMPQGSIVSILCNNGKFILIIRKNIL